MRDALMSIRDLAMVATAAALVTPVLSAAQSLPPTGNLEERSRQQIRVPAEAGREDALMTGDTDILLLRRTRLFNIHGSADVSWTSNAYLSPGARISDGFTQVQAGAGIGTRIAERVSVFADARVSTVRYFSETSLDYSTFTGAIGVSGTLGPAMLSGLYLPAVVYTRDFGDRELTAHRFRVAGVVPFVFRGTRVDTELHVERASTQPADYSAWSAGVTLSASRMLFPSAAILGYVAAGYDRRYFDDYFEAFVGTSRRDRLVSAGAGLVWRPGTWGQVRLDYGYGHNVSTSDVNGYVAHSGMLGLSATLRF